MKMKVKQNHTHIRRRDWQSVCSLGHGWLELLSRLTGNHCIVLYNCCRLILQSTEMSRTKAEIDRISETQLVSVQVVVLVLEWKGTQIIGFRRSLPCTSSPTTALDRLNTFTKAPLANNGDGKNASHSGAKQHNKSNGETGRQKESRSRTPTWQTHYLKFSGKRRRNLR